MPMNSLRAPFGAPLFPLISLDFLELRTKLHIRIGSPAKIRIRNSKERDTR